MGGRRVDSEPGKGPPSPSHRRRPGNPICGAQPPRGAQPQLSGRRLLGSGRQRDQPVDSSPARRAPGAWSGAIPATAGGAGMDPPRRPVRRGILDMSMPEMDGLELTAAIREQRRPKRCQSSSARAGTPRSKAEELHIAAFLTQALKQSQLYTRWHNLCRAAATGHARQPRRPWTQEWPSACHCASARRGQRRQQKLAAALASQMG